MLNIDAKRLLSQDHMAMFLNDVSETDPIIITFADNEIVTDKNGLYEFFKSQKYADMGDDTEIILANEQAILQIVGYDYTWWNTTRRVNRLFSGPKTAKSKSNDNSAIQEVNVRVSIGYYVKDSIPDEIITYEGSRKQAVEWLNKHYQLYSLKAKFVRPIVIAIDDNPWKSILEYVKDGRIILE